ncbi:hypothetical protein BN2476_40002 [Paraburkholderia piptadeniae]|uniref:Uncharacterized protein n=1 Tax=Paraburkholderia piptadeniae TaxID=1701573 RepID=A0A1N7RJY5_9BURK|nr:hypothetical protein BN2476_40002 [Paraburkholderia piptadeniae]
MTDIKPLLSAYCMPPLLSVLQGMFPTPRINSYNAGSYNRRLQGGSVHVRCRAPPTIAKRGLNE